MHCIRQQPHCKNFHCSETGAALLGVRSESFAQAPNALNISLTSFRVAVLQRNPAPPSIQNSALAAAVVSLSFFKNISPAPLEHSETSAPRSPLSRRGGNRALSQTKQTRRFAGVELVTAVAICTQQKSRRYIYRGAVWMPRKSQR
jgi:hypothetical protein